MEFLKKMVQKPGFGKRLLLCTAAVCLMGVCVSWLDFVSLDTDPGSCMNLGLAQLFHMSFGNWSALFYSVLFMVVLLLDRSKLGIGTLLNMFLVGYACDFMTNLRQLLWPELAVPSLPGRLLIMVAALAGFVLCAAVYLSVDLGTAPYDAFSQILTDKLHRFSFREVRIVYDCVVVLIGFLSGSTVGIATLLVALTVGPAAAFVEKRMKVLLAL